MFEKFKQAVDHIVSLLGTREEMEEIFSSFKIILLLSIPWTAENAAMVEEMDKYLYEKSGINLSPVS